MQGRALCCALLLVSLCAVARAEPDSGAGADGPAFPMLPDDGRPSGRRDALVLVVEGLDGVIRPDALRARLATVFGRPVIALSDSGSEVAGATLWLAADAKQVTLRLSTPPRPDLWRRVPRAKLGNDPAAALISALLDMLWSERTKPMTEMRDPFCPPGMVCDAEGTQPARRPAEQVVLDPWDPAYARFDRGGRGYTRGESWENEPPAAVSDAAASPRYSAPTPALDRRPAELARRGWALAALVGGGVHQAGGFARYEVNALRRFARFDIGLTFVGGRGQPNAGHARRTVAALGQYRWISEGLEVDLGASFGIFFAERYAGVDVRPHLRGLGVFAIETPSPLAVLIQSELGTTFTRVGSTGVVEYALSVGTRYGF